MNITEHYNKLYKDSVNKIRTDKYVVDKLIDSPLDNRTGITLLIRPDKNVKRKILNFQDKLKHIEPKQYFYPSSDLHVTTMSIISCYAGFSLSQIIINEYVNIIEKSIKGIPGFEIEFRGLTASPSCLMVQGFFKTDHLTQIRNHLRSNFRNSNLEHSIDKRYVIQTAHSTIFRIKEKFKNKEKFLKLIEKYKDHYFGSIHVDKLELVFNDWYQREKKVKKIYEFTLLSKKYSMRS